MLSKKAWSRRFYTAIKNKLPQNRHMRLKLATLAFRMHGRVLTPQESVHEFLEAWDLDREFDYLMEELFLALDADQIGVIE